jgi:hypothetical protein
MTVALCHVNAETMRDNLDAVRQKVWSMKDVAVTGDDDFGLYVERRVREYSSELEDIHYMILTRTPTLTEVPLEGTVEQWVARTRAAYTSVNAQEDNMRCITSICPKAECIKHDMTNVFIRDNSTWRFINCAWTARPSDAFVFVRTHPSVGYSKFAIDAGERSKVVPMDMGYTERITALETMEPTRRRHIEATHRWESPQSVHLRAQSEARDWRRTAPLRAMGIYDPISLHVIAIKLGYPRTAMTLDRGCMLTNESVYYDFTTIVSQLGVDAINMFRPEFVEGDEFILKKRDCERFGIASAARGAAAP